MGATALQMAREAGRRGRSELLDFARLTRPQLAVVSDSRRLTLWRDGNRLGKSYAAAWEIVHRCRGTHPYLKTHRPPIRVLCVSYSLEQMEPLMGALWSLLPHGDGGRGELDPRNGYDKGRGITGKPARILFTSGPGRGSVVQFATYKAGAQRVAGGAYHFVICDEPPTESMYGELKPRILTTRGTFRMFMTPTPDSPPLQWLRDLVDAGVVGEHNYGLNQDNTWPIGAPRPLLFQKEIDDAAATWLGVEREMRLNGAWEPVVTGRWLTAYTEERNVRAFALSELAGAWVCVGIDHGLKAGKQASMLLAMIGRNTMTPRVFWIDETVSTVGSSPAEDAAAIMAMLRRHGLGYDDVDDWVGDRPTGDSRWQKSKNNRDLQAQISRLVGQQRELKHIHTPKKWAGSVTHGLRQLNQLFGASDENGAPRGVVHPRCKQFAAFCERFKGDSRDPLKDVGDAGRYPVERNVSVQHTGGPSRIVFA